MDKHNGEEGKDMDLSIVTVQDCMEMSQYRGMAAVLNDGRVLGFRGNKYDITAEKGGVGYGIRDMSVLRGKP